MNVPRTVALVVCLLTVVTTAFAQPRVDPLNMYERVLLIVPVAGAGTAADPVRPKYAPLAADIDPQGLKGIMGFTAVYSDDGKFALIELVSRNRSVFTAALADGSIQAFLKGRDSRSAAEAAFQKLKKNFSIANFGVIVP